jgi:hypothetical protein
MSTERKQLSSQSTGNRVMSLNQLTRGKDKPSSLFSGRTEKLLVSTQDYEVYLMTHMNYSEADSDKGESATETFFEIYHTKDGLVRRFDFPSEIEAYLNAYMLKITDMVKVKGKWEFIDYDLFDKTKDTMGTKPKSTLTFKDGNLIISQVVNLSVPEFEGFIPKAQAKFVEDIKGLYLV